MVASGFCSRQSDTARYAGPSPQKTKIYPLLAFHQSVESEPVVSNVFPKRLFEVSGGPLRSSFASALLAMSSLHICSLRQPVGSIPDRGFEVKTTMTLIGGDVGFISFRIGGEASEGV